MTGRNGYEVAAFVKGRADLAHIPVLLMAGMFESADENRASAIGCAEILIKPLKPHQLLDRVRHWLRNDAVTDAPSLTSGVLEPQPAPASASPATSSPAQAAEDYFTRLDAAFQSLGPLGTRIGQTEGDSRAETTAGMSEPVPTLQQLLDRLPEETRSRLTPSVPAPDVASSGPEPMALDALVERVVEQLFRRTDLMDELVRRLARSVDRDQAR
jgi:CheY-like chemotaxis protein